MLAFHTYPSIKSSNDSRLKVENVVKAPKNPTVSPSLRVLLISGRPRKKVDNQPKANEPKTLTNRVPYGSESPKYRPISLATKNLDTDPNPPPIAIARIESSDIHITEFILTIFKCFFEIDKIIKQGI